jgi:hypothetical protein
MKDDSTPSTPEDMPKEQRDLSTQFAGATIMGSAAAMKDCLNKGVKVWDDDSFFGYPLRFFREERFTAIGEYNSLAYSSRSH